MAAAGLKSEAARPAFLEATEPPEARGLRRDEVRLLVSHVDRDALEHARFADLLRFLSAGDLLVVNTSRTLKSALNVTTEHGERFELHLSTRLPGGFWTAELRQPGPIASLPYRHALAGTTLLLPADARATLLAPYPLVDTIDSPSRLWIVGLQLPEAPLPYLERHGFPIRYAYVPDPWPIEMYQSVFADEDGSAEMPSAGRPFTPDLVTRLVSRGIQIAPLVLHTGVSSLEDHEPPYEEFYRVPRETAERINAARRAGHRIVGVGTTVVRALETVTDDRGYVSPGEGWTSLVVTPERPLRSVDGLITGLHEPHASHLMLLESVAAAAAGREASSDRHARATAHLQRAYAVATREGYLWHEFGDSHLIYSSAEA
jgi:S-adenosylmethionine:tRNA ribosyltransferase-isomerase